MTHAPSADWLAELTRFDPAKAIDDPPSWDDAAPFLSRHGLAGIAAYNLQYRMPFARAPEAVKDMLLGHMQGISGDTIFKLMTLKNLVGTLEGRQVVLLDGAAFGETLYPHIAFRPVPELRLLVAPKDVEPIELAMRGAQFFEMDSEEPDPDGPAKVLFNDRFFVKLYAHLLPHAAAEPGLLERAIPAKALGAGVFRLEAEDALLVHVLSMARRGFVVPLMYFVDLRQMVVGEGPPMLGRGPGAPLDREVVLSRAKAFGVERALWASMELTAYFHPDVAEKAKALQPELGLPIRKVLETAVIHPAKELERERQLRGVGKLVQLLIG